MEPARAIVLQVAMKSGRNTLKGIIILTEGRSGSNWLGSLLKSTNAMGKPQEWLDHHILGSIPSTSDELVRDVVSKASTENGRFAVKVFPRHLRMTHSTYGIDFVRELITRYDVGIVRLSRIDRERQAISYARGMMTSQWTSRNEVKVEPVYSFKAVCEAYFHIERSEAFWNAYLRLNGVTATHFVYEELLADPSPFVREAARMLDVPFPERLQTDLKIQRDELTEEWLAAFKDDVKRESPLSHASGRPASRTFQNLKRFFRRQPLTPF